METGKNAGRHHSVRAPEAFENGGAGAGTRLRTGEMVWKTIEHGKPRAGSLEAKIKPGSWVIIKPSIIALKSQANYHTGDGHRSTCDTRAIRIFGGEVEGVPHHPGGVR